MSVIENPWRNFDEFDPASFEGQSSEPPQWPIKLWKAPVTSPYFHKAHLLVAADCSAFSYVNFHAAYAAGKVPLICCPATDFDITSRLADILRHNDVRSVTVVQMERWKQVLDGLMATGQELGLSPVLINKVFEAVHQESIERQSRIMEND